MAGMKVIDLVDEHRDLFAVCLEDWSPEVREARPGRACWVERYLERGLRAKLAVDDHGTVGGMIQYLPIEQWPMLGEGLYFIPCIWVHGHSQGRGDFRGKGMGPALLAAAEADARALGAQGMAAWGLALPFWMRASWYRKQGYRRADRRGMSALVWKPFTPEARPPRWLPPGKRLPDPVPGKVNVVVFNSAWCSAGNLTAVRARRAAAEMADRVHYREVDTSERATAVEWGQTDGLYVDGRQVRTGPPPSYEKIRKAIARRVGRLPASGSGR
jgi:GNAT superfamily N-acetyltransferase